MDDLTAATELARKDARLFSLELFIAKFLRYGVLTAGLFIFFGWMMQIDLHHNIFLTFEHYQHVRLFDTIQQIIHTGDWSLLIAYFGLILLIALPLTRVALVAIVFLVDHDYTLAFCSLLVLFGLGLSFVLGFEI